MSSSGNPPSNCKPMDNTLPVDPSQPATPKVVLDIPAGFVELVEPFEDGQRLVRVPKHWLEHHAHERGAYRKKAELEVKKQSNGNGGRTSIETADLTIVRLEYPANPELSNHERLNLHAEVLALQERLGISYKDACHRLYLAEIEKNKAFRDSLSAAREFQARVQQAASFAADSQPANTKPKED
ncbi:hypothetical protein D9613_011581 [Agrocybe pediades]|uniref:Uncharacterized protein n=1 Tax=Agrocybe pediades TaxID=84607 RepID=A0A8H4QWL4_9AGAR|nr:hypothetical protein D9613_012869 [Agrocybe pediades]KAF4618334.1 hypothetical protein D9613_011581 [Agrocybe pediades]KAF9546262.1 hypothetical protein CPC08DRAFT_755611 [Agrocybe pediades]